MEHSRIYVRYGRLLEMNTSKLTVLALSVALFLAVFVAGCAMEWSEPEGKVRGDSTTERVGSLVEILNSENEDFAYVYYVKYNTKDNAWEFMIFVKEPFGKVFSSGASAPPLGIDDSASLINRYDGLIKDLFVGVSKESSGKSGEIRAKVIFSDSVGWVESTDEMAKISARPREWQLYMEDRTGGKEIILEPIEELEKQFRKRYGIPE